MLNKKIKTLTLLLLIFIGIFILITICRNCDIDGLIKVFDQEDFIILAKDKPRNTLVAQNPKKYAYSLRFNSKSGDQFLDRFDVSSNNLICEIKLPKDRDYNHFAVNKIGGCYISTDRTSSDSVSKVDYFNPETNRIEQHLKLDNSRGNISRGMIYDKENGKKFVWTPVSKSSGVKIISLKTGKVVGKIPYIKHIFTASLVAPNKLYISVADYKGKNAIVFFDTKTNEIIGHVDGFYTVISR